jgi:hypothetical protein
MPEQPPLSRAARVHQRSPVPIKQVPVWCGQRHRMSLVVSHRQNVAVFSVGLSSVARPVVRRHMKSAVFGTDPLRARSERGHSVQRVFDGPRGDLEPFTRRRKWTDA